jgi:hypothetical protein
VHPSRPGWSMLTCNPRCHTCCPEHPYPSAKRRQTNQTNNLRAHHIRFYTRE